MSIMSVFVQLSCADDTFLCFDSDLALRNCLLTSEMSVKIGDYGLSHSRYKVRPSHHHFIILLTFTAPPSRCSHVLFVVCCCCLSIG